MKYIKSNACFFSLFFVLTLFVVSPLTAGLYRIENEPDSAYLFAYATNKNENKNGVHFAWSIDKKDWHSVGNEHGFFRSDYGRWGSQKRLFTPYLYYDSHNTWHCVFSVNEDHGTYAHTSSKDLVNWIVQSYPKVMDKGNCLLPEIVQKEDDFIITWISNKEGEEGVYGNKTRDFAQFTETKKISDGDRLNNRVAVLIHGNKELGTLHKVAWNVIDNLIKAYQIADYKHKLWSENTSTDQVRFANLKPLTAKITVDTTKSKAISDMLVGIFFEDINYAADGGLYAELIQNRGFEYSSDDRGDWNNKTSWSVVGHGITFDIDTIDPIHLNNRHYAVLNITDDNGALLNDGFDGIPVLKGDHYDFSIFSRLKQGKGGSLLIQLVDENESIVAEGKVRKPSVAWKKQKVVLKVTKTTENARLKIIPQGEGIYHLDMISLFPQKTFKGRKNGLRSDLAQVLADIKPRFVRFPGGCLVHGDGLENIYRWKNTIGPLEARKGQRNIWGYHQSVGLGYYEYFQFCEDIGAEPLPVVAAGVPCQNSGTGGAGQQGGIPMCEMDDYVQEVLDLIEWANGDKNSKWGRLRAEAGHPEPFNLKYIGVGNEDLITKIFEERFEMIYNAVKEKHPEITVIGTVGPFSEGSDYVVGWDFASRLEVPIVDEHYYQPPGWYIHNQDYYDRYDRNKPKVYVGEFAAHLPARQNNIETALSEAIHMNNIERNADVVVMTSYAPLLAKEGHTQWNPDLIYFNNTEIKPTTGYYIQQLYGQNSGNKYLNSDVSISHNNQLVQKRFSVSVVKDDTTDDYIVKLVNLLPVSVTTDLIIPGIDLINTIANCTVLQGAPEDRLAKPKVRKLSGINKIALPAYSFTVIRF